MVPTLSGCSCWMLRWTFFRFPALRLTGEAFRENPKFWRLASKAVSSFVDESHVDASRVLLDSIEASDEEDEGEAQAEDVGSLPVL